MALQTLARVFLATEHNLASLVIAEEIRSDRRGAALSVLGWLSTTGRAFEVAEAAERIQPSLWPRVGPEHRGNLVRVCALVAACRAVQTPAFLYAADLAQDRYDWDATFTVIVVASGVATAFGFWLGGRASDRIGRRPGRAGGLMLTSLATSLVFTESPALFAPGWFALVASYACLNAVVLAHLAELFPTEVRATLTACALAGQIVSGSVGLVAVAALEGALGSSDVVLAGGLVLMPALVLLRRLPETAGVDVIRPRTGVPAG